jgi:hypothetical protein
MSYIKREPLLQIAKELQGQVFGAPLIVRAIEEAPEENVVEVCHCKDCVYCEQSYLCKKKGEESRLVYDCHVLYVRVMPDFYCGFGQKEKENRK